MHEGETDRGEGSTPTVPPPFEQLDRYGFFPGLFMTVKLALTSPRLFFSVMPMGGGLTKPLTFAILLAMLQGFAQFIWGATGMSVSLDMMGQELTPVPFSFSKSLFQLLLTPAIVATELFLVAGLFHLGLVVLGGAKAGFEGTFRASAYSFAPIVLGIVPLVSLNVLSAWMFTYMIWRFTLTAIGLKNIHGISYAKTIPALILPILLLMILAMGLIQAGQTMI